MLYPTNPALLLPDEFMDVVRLWNHYKGGFGSGHLPDAGGVNDQSSWLMDAFGILDRKSLKKKGD